MSIRLYMDVHVDARVSAGLSRRGCDVLTAQEDGATTLDDVALLERCALLGRVIFTQDTDFLIEAVRRQSVGEGFAGVIYLHQRTLSVAQSIDALAYLAEAGDDADFSNAIEYLANYVR